MAKPGYKPKISLILNPAISTPPQCLSFESVCLLSCHEKSEYFVKTVNLSHSFGDDKDARTKNAFGKPKLQYANGKGFLIL